MDIGDYIGLNQDDGLHKKPNAIIFYHWRINRCIIGLQLAQTIINSRLKASTLNYWYLYAIHTIRGDFKVTSDVLYHHKHKFTFCGNSNKHIKQFTIYANNHDIDGM